MISNILLIDLEMLNRLKLLAFRLYLKVSDGHFFLMMMLIFESRRRKSVVSSILLFVVLIRRVNIAEDIVDIMYDDGFQNSYFFLYFDQLLNFRVLIAHF